MYGLNIDVVSTLLVYNYSINIQVRIEHAIILRHVIHV